MKKRFNLILSLLIILLIIFFCILYSFITPPISYNQVIDDTTNVFSNKIVNWQGVINKNSQINGIKFNIIDSEHTYGNWSDYDWFWAVPKEKDVKNKIISNWIEFTLNKYGNIKNYNTNDIFLIKGKIINLDCTFYDYSTFNKKICLPNIEIISIKKYEQ